MASDVLAWGVVGAGDIVGKRVAPALRESPACDLVAICRARAELAEGAAARLGARRWYAHWQQLVDDGEIRAVYIATPVHLHASQTIAAAEAGKHVLCEKPMAMDAAECDRMIAACCANGVKLGVAYYRRFYPVVGRVANLLRSGEIGAPVVVQMNAFESFNPQPGEARHWLLKRAESGGGPMFDFGCHRVELLIHLFGPIRRVASVLANVAFEREVEDTAAVAFQFAGGPCATLAVTHAARDSQDTFDVFGTRGSLHLASLNRGELRVRVDGEERLESHPPAANLHRPLIDDFVDAVLTGRDPAVTGATGRAVAEIEDRIYGQHS